MRREGSSGSSVKHETLNSRDRNRNEGTWPYIIEEMNSSSFNEGPGPGGVKEDTRETRRDRRRREVVTLMRRTTG